MSIVIQYPVVDQHEVNLVILQKDNGDVASVQTTDDLIHIRKVTLQYLVTDDDLGGFLGGLETAAVTRTPITLDTPGYDVWGDGTTCQSARILGYTAPVRYLPKRYQVSVTYRRELP